MQENNTPVIILSAPQLALNVGMVARVMLNFNFKELRIVNPRDKDVISNALAASAGADNVLNSSKIYNSLKEAVSDLNIVYATSKRPRHLEKMVFNLYSVFNSNNECERIHSTNNKAGFLFGKEASGLSNDELNYANVLITIDTNPDFSSLNLAQAVALLCYEWNRRDSNLEVNNLSSSIKKKKKILATFADMEHFFNYLEDNLEKKNFFTVDKKATMVRNFRNIFLKNQLNRSEVQTLFSIAKALNNDL